MNSPTSPCLFCGKRIRLAKTPRPCPDCCDALRRTGLFKPDAPPSKVVEAALGMARPGAETLIRAASEKTFRSCGLPIPASISLLEVLIAMSEVRNPWDILEQPEVISRLRTAWMLAYMVPGNALLDNYIPILRIVVGRLGEPVERHRGRPPKSDAVQDVLIRNLDVGIEQLATAIGEDAPDKAAYYNDLRQQLIEPTAGWVAVGARPRPEASQTVPPAEKVVADAHDSLAAHQNVLPPRRRRQSAANAFSVLFAEIARAGAPLSFLLAPTWREILGTYGTRKTPGALRAALSRRRTRKPRV